MASFFSQSTFLFLVSWRGEAYPARYGNGFRTQRSRTGRSRMLHGWAGQNEILRQTGNQVYNYYISIFHTKSIIYFLKYWGVKR